MRKRNDNRVSPKRKKNQNKEIIKRGEENEDEPVWVKARTLNGKNGMLPKGELKKLETIHKILLKLNIKHKSDRIGGGSCDILVKGINLQKAEEALKANSIF